MENLKILNQSYPFSNPMVSMLPLKDSPSFMQFVPLLFPGPNDAFAMLSPPCLGATTTIAQIQSPLSLDDTYTMPFTNDSILNLKLAAIKTNTSTKIPSIDYQRPLGVIDKFVLLSELGQDHLYPVYLASSIFDSPSIDGSNLVVLKAIPAADYRGSFQNETDVFKLKYHKHLLNCTEVIKNVKFHFSSIPKKNAEASHPTPSDDFYHIMILKYHSNGDFLELVKKRCLEERIARYYFGQILDAVEYLHLNGYCHRDLKIENILLDQNYNLVLSDFGHSVKYKDQDGERLFKEKTSITTPGICPPEFHQGLWISRNSNGYFCSWEAAFDFYYGFQPFFKHEDN